MRVEVVALAGAAETVRADAARSAAYFELLDALGALEARRHGRSKSRPEYVYDQTAFIDSSRAVLERHQWSRGRVLAPASESFGVRMAPVSSDLIKAGVHVIFEFGNRASYAYNTLSRFALGCATGVAMVTTFVVPTLSFANAIDSNLATFERLAGEFARLERLMPRIILARL